MSRSALLLAALLVASPAVAQARLAFDAPTHDLGPIAEADGPVGHTFRFTNAGDAPLRLTEVTAACGCTTPSWTSAAVAPGGSGEVTVVYDPAGRPGDFEKAVFVQTDAAVPGAVTLRISGVVRSALADSGVRIGALAFDKTTADVGLLPAEGETAVQTAFQFANVGNRPIRIDSVSAPAGVRVVFPPRATFPDQVGGLFVMADHWRAGRLTSGHGFVFDLVLHTDDAEAPTKTVHVVGQVEALQPRHHGTIQTNGE